MRQMGVAVLAMVIFLQCSLLRANEAFLVGEDTPVWFAERPDPSKPVIYTKLPQGTVKEAIDSWQVMRTSGGFPVRGKRSINNTNYSEPYISTESTETEGKGFVQRRSTDDRTLNPSVLLIVDYGYFHPISESNKEKVIKERILYALAFWRTVNTELNQHIPSPKVSLRISGIVITRDRTASPYIDYRIKHSFNSMLGYWYQVAKTNQDFAIGSHKIIVHMTDTYYEMYKDPHWELMLSTVPTASFCSPCNQVGNIAGMILVDDFAFKEIHPAVKKMTNIFGDDARSDIEPRFQRKKWTETSLSKIFKGLQGSNGDCMLAAKEHHTSGNPINPPMPGELLSRTNQCEVFGFSNNSKYCRTGYSWPWTDSVCVHMGCAERHWYSGCYTINPTLDGTPCNVITTKICMTGKCVDKN